MSEEAFTAGLKPGHTAYILFCVQGPLEEFRIPEILSIIQLFALDVSWPVPPDHTRPYMLIGLPGEKEARLLGSRLVSAKHVWEYWAHAETYPELHELVRGVECRAKWEPYAADRECTWKFTIAGHQRTIPLPQQVALVNTFSYMPFLGDINLRTPDLEIGVFEEYTWDPLRGAKVREARQAMGAEPSRKGKEKALEEGDPEDTGGLRMVWMGRKICDTSRHLMDVFDLKKRAYIGTTSMEAEASLLMVNQALAAPGKWVYDPFAGTGSMLLTAAAFGAMTFGSDIDGRQLRGKKTSIKHSAAQYGVSNRIVDTFAFDMTQHPFRTGELFDAIVTDPPYGVRAGAKRLGREKGADEVAPMVVKGREAEGYHHQFHDYVPPSVGWPMEEVISTLVTFALYLLRPGGRLVFFLPTDNAEYSDLDVPSVPGLRLVSNSLQSYGKWGRRLITMEKARDASEGAEWRRALEGLDRGIPREGRKSAWEEERGKGAGEEKRPGHADFNRRYFAGFDAVKEGVRKLVVGDKQSAPAETPQ
ncbi:hypothetical protein Rhopal_002836-T1 [Rhodotorula paludigena]|uniref:tRNA (guanine(10)-N(2))-methyltransferase n=1 Tax=Rhodotorula paludigena TaxID=86838 RepID=A0AAV5GKD7_9BASI|nr:hypothetical protein Rhopal_002836-T1 [Rhodotorula paludigena]